MRKYKIAIVENDEDEQFFMKEGFDATGLFDVMVQAKNGDVFFEWLKKSNASKPDIILSDLNMPGKNGYDVITEIKSNDNYARIPVIITSTSSTESIKNKCLALGAAHYLTKPEVFIDYTAFVKQLYDFIEKNDLVQK